MILSLLSRFEVAYRRFFMPKFKHKEMKAMLKDEILEKIFSNKEMQMIPIGCQSTAVSVFEDVLEELRKENPYANISDLLSTDE